MKPLSVWLVLAIGGTGLAVGSLLTAVVTGLGHSPIVFTPWLAVLFILVGVWLLVAGHAVKRLRGRQKTWIAPVGAARTAILARSSAPVMSAFAGLLLGVAVVAFFRAWAPAMAYAAWMALAGALGAIFASVSGTIVERWCIDEGGEHPGDFGGPSADRNKRDARSDMGPAGPEPQRPRTVSPASPDRFPHQHR